MDENLKYIEENFIELHHLCEMAQISVEELDRLIEDRVIPEPSYIIQVEHSITSPLNDHYKCSTTKKYFANGLVDLIKQNLSLKEPGSFKEKFKKEFLEQLLKHRNKEYAYGNIFSENGFIDEEQFELAFEKEWDFYCTGVYGICTLNATEKEIVEKEIAVKKLIEFNKQFLNRPLTDTEKDQLKELNNEFNKIASPCNR